MYRIIFLLLMVISFNVNAGLPIATSKIKYCVENLDRHIKWCTIPFGNSVVNQASVNKGSIFVITQERDSFSFYYDKCPYLDSLTLECDNRIWSSGTRFNPTYTDEPVYGYSMLAGNGDIYFVFSNIRYRKYGLYSLAKMHMYSKTIIYKGRIIDNATKIVIDHMGEIGHLVRIEPQPAGKVNPNNVVKLTELDNPFYLDITKEVVFGF